MTNSCYTRDWQNLWCLQFKRQLWNRNEVWFTICIKHVDRGLLVFSKNIYVVALCHKHSMHTFLYPSQYLLKDQTLMMKFSEISFVKLWHLKFSQNKVPSFKFWFMDMLTDWFFRKGSVISYLLCFVSTLVSGPRFTSD